MAFAGDFTPVFAKHSKSFSLIDCISVGIDRNATQLRADAKAGRGVATERANGCTAKVVIYEALVTGRREAQRDILPTNSFRLWRNLPKEVYDSP